MVKRRLAGTITEQSVWILFKGTRIGTLTRRMNDACEEEYVFKIDWEIWDSLDADDTVPGINMDARLDEYVRDFVPAFLREYLPPLRQDTPELLKRLGLKHYDIWDIMVTTRRRVNDDFTVEPIDNN